MSTQMNHLAAQARIQDMHAAAESARVAREIRRQRRFSPLAALRRLVAGAPLSATPSADTRSGFDDRGSVLGKTIG